MIHICLATDDNFSKYCQICIHETILHKKEDTSIHFYVLGDKLSDTSVFEMFNEIPNITVTVIPVNSSKIVDPNFKYRFCPGLTTFARYVITELEELKDIDRVLYLDSDIIVKGDLTELYNIDLENNPIGGVKNPWIIYTNRVTDTINAGVLVMDLVKLREDNFAKKCITNTLNNKTNDEVIINGIYSRKIKFLSVIYNFPYSLVIRKAPRMCDINTYIEHYNVPYKSMKELIENAVVLHLVGFKTLYKNMYLRSNVVSEKLQELVSSRLEKFIQTKEYTPIQIDNDLNTVFGEYE